MKKRLLSMFLVLCILFTQIPSTVFAADDSSVPIDALLDLSSVTGEVNCIAESGHIHDNNQPCWAWYAEGVEVDDKTYTGKVLVLNGANIVATTQATGISLPDQTTVVTVVGSINTVTAANNSSGDSHGIYGAGDLTFDGKGTLNVAGGEAIGGFSYGIYAEGNVRIDGGSVNAIGATFDGSGGDTYTVSFDPNGGQAFEPVTVAHGGTLSELPVPGKSGSVFTGWYLGETIVGTDTQFFDDAILVARYETITGNELQYTDTTYTQSDALPTLNFPINASGKSADAVKAALTLEVLDNSGDITLNVTGSGSSFTITADGGFTPGGAYRLTLGDGLTFDGKDVTIRSCEFTIARDEVFDIDLSDSLKYIPMNRLTDITQNGEPVQELNTSLYTLTTDGGGRRNDSSGTFKLTSGTLSVGDVVCLYSGDQPVAGDDEKYSGDSIAYVKIANVSSGVYSFVSAEPEEVLILPEVLPVDIDQDKDGNRNNNSITVPKAAFDYSDPVYAEVGLTTGTSIDQGDYLALYEGTYGPDATIIAYGRVISADLVNGEYVVVYEIADEEDIANALNYYSENEIDAYELIENVNVSALEEDIERQAIDSGFAKAAASYLATAAIETDGFNGAIKGFQPDTLRVTLEGGNEVSLSEMRALGASVVPTNLEVDAKITTNGDHFGKGSLQCALDVSFTLALYNEDDQGISLTVSATFIEEVKMVVDVSGDTIWKWKWIFPYIADYRFNANLDVYNYTYINFSAQVTTKEGDTISDISEQMKSILALTDGDNIKGGVSELHELYSDLMEAGGDWITIFEEEISRVDMHLLLGIINIRITTSFVVSVDMNVALGMQYEHISGDRYTFWLKIKAKDAGSNTVRLIDQQSTFEFYIIGALGIKAGVSIEIAVGLFSVDLASVGLGAEAGAYIRLYGLFFYKTVTTNGQTTYSNASGALYMELGVYVDLTFKAQAIGGKFQYSPSLYYKEWPILKAGKKEYVFDFWNPNAKEVRLKDSQRTYRVPDNFFDLAVFDLKTGDVSLVHPSMLEIEIASSNPNVRYSAGYIEVMPPAGARYVTATITVRYKNAQLAFTSMPITRTIHVYWDNLRNPYHITFEGSDTSPLTANYDEPISPPTEPTKAGYSFDGWYKNAGLTDPYTFPAFMPAENITLYAKWNAQPVGYKVEHYTQSLKGGNPVLVETDSPTALAESMATPPRKNYTGFDQPEAQTVTVNGDGSTVIKYVYPRANYTVTFKPGYSGQPDIVSQVPFDGDIILPVMSRVGHTFTGWNTTPATKMPASNLSYTAQWSVNRYNVTYTLDGIEQTKPGTSGTFDYGSPLYMPEVAEGFEFLGWYTDAACTISLGQATVPARDVQLFGKIALKNSGYTVEHYQENISDNGYTVFETELLPGYSFAAVAAVPKTYEDYEFDSSIKGTVTTGKVKADGSLVLKLYYKRHSYTVTFDGNGNTGGSMADQIFKFGERKNLARNEFTKTESGIPYDFVGWTTNSDGSGTRYADQTEIQDLLKENGESITLYAQWLKQGTVAKIGDTEYDNMHTAFKAVAEGQTIKLARDFYTDWISVSASLEVNFTLDLNGYLFEHPTLPAISTSGLGTLTVIDSFGGGRITSGYPSTISVTGSSTLKLISGTIDNTHSNTANSPVTISVGEFASFIMEGGTVSSALIPDYAYAICNSSSTYGITGQDIRVSGGTIIANGNAILTGVHNIMITGGTVESRNRAAINHRGNSGSKITIGGNAEIISANSYDYEPGTIFVGDNISNIEIEITGGTIDNSYSSGSSGGYAIAARNSRTGLSIKGGSPITIKSRGNITNGKFSQQISTGDFSEIKVGTDYDGNNLTNYLTESLSSYKYFTAVPTSYAAGGFSLGAANTNAPTMKLFGINHSETYNDMTSMELLGIGSKDSNESITSIEALSLGSVYGGGYGIYGSTITINGGKVTAAGDKAMNVAPILSGYTGSITTASMTTDGQNTDTYNPSLYDTYQYISVKPTPTYGISLSQSGTYTFPEAIYGYSTQTPLTVTVYNTGNEATGDLTVSLSGTLPIRFSTNNSTLSSIEEYGSTTFTVYPGIAFNAGTYSATVMVSGNNNLNASFTVSFTVVPVSVTSVTVKTPPTKVNYIQGEKLDLSGLVVTLHKNNGTREDVSFADFSKNGLTVSPANNSALTPANDKVTITHSPSGNSTEQSISVKGVSAVSVKTKATKDEYKIGEKLDLNGLVVTLKLSDNSTIDVVPNDFTKYGISVIPQNGTTLSPSNTKVTISHTSSGMSADQSISVYSVDALQIEADPKREYIAGQTLNLSGLVVRITYANGDTEDVAFGKFAEKGLIVNKAHGTVLNTDGTVTVTHTASGKTVNIDYTVVPVQVSSISISKAPTKVNYYEGDLLDLSGLEVTLQYNNETTAVVPVASFAAKGITVNPALGTALSISNTKVVISVGSVSVEQSISVSEVFVTGISVTTAPRTAYVEGDKLDLNNLVVTLHKNNTSSEDIPFAGFVAKGITVSLEHNTVLTTGDTTVTISMGSLTAEQNITVVPLAVSSISISNPLTKAAYFEGDLLDLTGLEVTLHYNNGTTGKIAFADFADNGIMANPADGSVLAGGQNTVAITYTATNVSVTQSINVTPIVVTSITVSASPDEIDYYEGDKLDLSGLVVTLNKINGTTEVVPFANFASSGLTTSPTDGAALTAGTTKVTITHTASGLTAEQDINVTEVVVSAISVKTQPTKTTYYEGDPLDLSGLVVTLHKNNGDEDVALASFAGYGITVTPENGTVLATGELTMTITHAKSGNSAVLSFPVDAVVMTSISVKALPKVSYIEGENLDLSGLIITLHYNNGSSLDTAYADFTASNIGASHADGIELTTGTIKVIITHNETGKTAEITVNTSAFRIPVTGISLEPTSIMLYSNIAPNTATIAETIAPFDATDNSVAWASSNTSVATVDAFGKVTAVSAGTAIITATTNDGGYTASCTVVVTTYVAPIIDTPIPEDNRNITVTPPSSEAPNSPTLVEIKVSASVDGEGSATIDITEKTVAEAIEKALAVAKRNGNEQNGITLVLRLETGSANISDLTVTLPKGVQELILTKGVVNTVVIAGSSGFAMELDAAAIAEINRQANADVSITVTRMDNSKLTDTARTAVGSRPVYAFTVRYGSGNQVQNFRAGGVSVTIPYSLGTNETAANVKAVYVDDNGNMHWLASSYYDSREEVLRFSTNHFSSYGVGYRKEAVFADIESHWAEKDIAYVVRRGLFGGTSDTTFSPNTAMSRGMFVTVLGRLANADVSGYIQSSFSDVRNDAYYMRYIEWASENNIVSGIGKGKFAPDQPITREQMAVIMQKYAAVIGFNLPAVNAERIFADSANIKPYAADAVKLMQMAGVLSGKTGNLFDPLGTTTRAEVSAVLRRFMELAISSEVKQGWTMSDSGKWMYYENGIPVTGKKIIVGLTYTFDQNGVTEDVPQNSKYTTYTMQRGDNLWSIASRLGCSVVELERLNNISRFTLIQPDDVLRVPEK